MLSFTYIQIWVFIFAAIIRYRPAAPAAPAAPATPATTATPAGPAEQEEARRVAFHELERFLVFYSWAINRSVLNSEDRKSFWHLRTWIKNHLKPFTSQYAIWVIALGFIWVSNMGIAPALIWALVLGEAAPANVNALFFPNPANGSLAHFAQDLDNIFKPAVLRGLTVAQISNPEAVHRVQLNQTNIGQTPDGEAILQFDYTYNISGVDFGMQHFGDLYFVLRGSCYTEYSWIVPGLNNSYSLWNNQNIAQNVTLNDEQLANPQATFINPVTVTNPLVNNNTYAAYVSTSWKSSLTPSTDPWYFTDSLFDPQTNSTSYSVKPNRPPLSCWETGLWTWKGQEIGNPGQFGYNVPGFPLFHRDVLEYLLWGSPTSFTAARLDTINLAASDQDVLTSFDAGAGSINKDLNRLLVTSFVWNSNILFDLTLNGLSNTYGIPNYISLSKNLTGAGDFVIYTSDVAALALIFVLVVPIVMILMMIANLVMGHGLEEDYRPRPKNILKKKILEKEDSKGGVKYNHLPSDETSL
ncbi:hypothetical protein L207DRAFT_182777 [Hyaloscypha variabilis F]|uniref:Uncharacterized protein n=1 Tax=Hyaloscypha variabilis (strain UAMH 11265 / GT02V1 / F) TaxID=1149755 RepID=A0A2J6R0E6_HYAVF|nr:hypothetical protein L207DRAFT_182777 [Hyaloscypha variabilis F]